MSDTILELPILRAMPPIVGSPAKLVFVNNRLAAQYEVVDRLLIWQNILTDKYIGGNINVKLFWITNPYSAGTINFNLTWRKLTAGIDYSLDTFDTDVTVSTSSAGLSLLNISNAIFTNAALGYNINSVDQLFQLGISVTALPGTNNVQLLNVLLENV